MDIKTLEEKVANAQAKVDKTKKTTERHKAQLQKKIVLLEKASDRKVGLTNFHSFLKEDFSLIDTFKWNQDTRESYSYYYEACDVSGKMRDIEDSKKKSAEAERILENWQAKLDKAKGQDNFVEQNAPQVIKDFLEEWKQLAHKWHIINYNAYVDFVKSIDEEVREAKTEALKTLPVYAEYLDEDGEVHEYYRNFSSIYPKSPMELFLEERELDYDTVKKAKKEYASGAILIMDSIRNEEERLAWLEKTLEAEKKAKLLDLITRINGIVGTITDATELKIKGGNLNGIITGEKGKAKVATIGAGGYNIQCFHYRTLIHEL